MLHRLECLKSSVTFFLCYGLLLILDKTLMYLTKTIEKTNLKKILISPLFFNLDKKISEKKIDEKYLSQLPYSVQFPK